METCLFCNRDEKYNRNVGSEYVCSVCVQLLCDADQDDLKRAYSLAIDKGYDRKAKAIGSFIFEEEQPVEKKPKFKIRVSRKREPRNRTRLATA